MKKKRPKKYHGFKRGDRISAAIHRLVASSLIVGLSDPRLSEISITAVEMTPDNRIAKVYFSMFGDEKQVAQARKGLVHSAPVLRKKIAEEIRLQYTPELRFFHDVTPQRAQKMESLFEQIRREGYSTDTDDEDDE